MALEQPLPSVTPAQALATLERRLGKYRESGDFYNFCCPFPHPAKDTKFRFGVNLRTGNYYCFRCERKGRIDEILGARITGAERTPHKALALRTPLAPSSMPLPPFREIPLENDGGPLCKPVLAYLASRGISQITAHALGIAYGNDSSWYNMAIHPYYEDDDHTLAGWQGRVIAPSPGSPKVYTATKEQWPGAMGAKDGALYLLETVRKGDPVVVTEGPYDALSVGRVLPAVACLGSVLHAAQARRLIRREPAEIIVGFDADKPKAGRDAARLLKKEWRGPVRLVRWPKKWGELDWGAMQRFQVEEILEGPLCTQFRIGE